MRSNFKLLAVFLLVSALVAGACGLMPDGLLGTNSKETREDQTQVSQPAAAATPTVVPASEEAASGGPVLLTGEFEYTNDFYPEGYAYEQAVSLIEMTGFITRDEEWEVPVESQVLGYLNMDTENNTGTYRLSLPARPAGTMNDVDQDSKKEAGVQVFAVEYTPNWTGGPFYVADDPYIGWPSYLASVTVDTENQDEVTGGRLVVWAPDADQEFPTGFGEDGLLFSADDPIGPIPAGYSVVDLDSDPFMLIRDEVVDLTLYEPSDVAVKDFSDQTYTEAFDSMFDIISKEYAFNGVKDKAPDWEALYADIYPRIEQAEKDADAYAYFLAMRDFSLAFKDGHVGFDGGDLNVEYNRANITGGYGFSIRELDDGRSIVVFVLEGGPADMAGMKVGAELLAVDGVDTADAISAVEPFSTQSTDYGRRYEQTIFLLHGPVGVDKELTFANPGDSSETVTLTSVWEMDSLLATYLGGEYDDFVLPVEYDILDSDIGYIKINSNSDDLNLSYRIFERALQIFQDYGLTSLIIDMRLNFGGAPLGVAGYFYDEDITLGQLEYYSDLTGKFEPEGDPDRIIPMQEQYAFDEIVLLVDQFCFSACEIEAYGLSQVPNVTVMGQFPTGGVEAETARGDFELPEGMSITLPTGRFILPDGSIMLEGVGVVPDIHIPVDEDTVLSEDDLVLQAAEMHLLGY